MILIMVTILMIGAGGLRIMHRHEALATCSALLGQHFRRRTLSDDTNDSNDAIKEHLVHCLVDQEFRNQPVLFHDLFSHTRTRAQEAASSEPEVGDESNCNIEKLVHDSLFVES